MWIFSGIAQYNEDKLNGKLRTMLSNSRGLQAKSSAVSLEADMGKRFNLA